MSSLQASRAENRREAPTRHLVVAEREGRCRRALEIAGKPRANRRHPGCTHDTPERPSVALERRDGPLRGVHTTPAPPAAGAEWLRLA